jgi:hypothetical protein
MVPVPDRFSVLRECLREARFGERRIAVGVERACGLLFRVGDTPRPRSTVLVGLQRRVRRLRDAGVADSATVHATHHTSMRWKPLLALLVSLI